LTAGVLGLLLSGAVLFVLAALLFAEGKTVEFFQALLGGVVALVCARLLGKGVTRCKRRANALAIAAAAAAIGLDPPVARAQCNQGFLCAQHRDYPRAIAHYDAAIELDPTLADAHVGRVNAYLAMWQHQQVIAEYTEAIQDDPNHALTYCARATAYNGIGRWDLSIPDATEAIRLAPGLYLGYDARAYGYMQRGSFNWILKLLAIAWMVVTFGFLRRDRFDWRTPVGSRADLERACADFTEALRLNPAAWDCHHGRARVYRALGKHAEAAADEARVRDAVPGTHPRY
jgi:tetratricopeptide (TPR) repeat protein